MWSARKPIVFASITLAVISSAAWLATVAVSHGKAPRSNSGFDPLAELERRISKLENAPLFRVVDQQGKPIFAIYRQFERYAGGRVNMAIAYNPRGRPSAFISASPDGGIFEAFSDDNRLNSLLTGDSDSPSGLRIFERINEEGIENDVEKLRLGGDNTAENGTARNYSLKFLRKSGQVIAGIGESKAGSGALVIGDSQGSRRVSMTIGENGKGIVGLFSANNKAILTLGEAVGNAGGSLAIGNANSDPMVKMGTNDDRYGVVMTFPVGFPYVPRSGLPGSYFLGCAGGKSCIP